MTQYDMVIIDEISMLSANDFDRIVAMWRAASKLPCLVLLGDFWRLPGPHRGATRLDSIPAWVFVNVIPFKELVRSQDPLLNRKLAALRTSIPSKELLRKICDRKHRAWTSKEPTAYDVLELFRRTRDRTPIVTCTRRAAATMNGLVSKALFEDRHKTNIGYAPFDWEANKDNYDQNGAVARCRRLKPASLRVFLTKNMDKKNDLVNGMEAKVVHHDAESKCIEVLTQSKQRLTMYLYTEPKKTRK